MSAFEAIVLGIVQGLTEVLPVSSTAHLRIVPAFVGWDDPEVALASAAVNWETAVGRVDDFARRLRPDQLLDVRFEDLVRDPGREVARVLAFAGLAHDPDVVA